MEKGVFQLEATISGKKITDQTVLFEEIETTSPKSDVSLQSREARYFRCDLSSLDLKKGTYRIDWIANNQRHFISLIEKK